MLHLCFSSHSYVHTYVYQKATSVFNCRLAQNYRPTPSLLRHADGLSIGHFNRSYLFKRGRARWPQYIALLTITHKKFCNKEIHIQSLHVLIVYSSKYFVEYLNITRHKQEFKKTLPPNINPII